MAAVAVTKEVIEPDNRFETPLIGRLQVTDGKLSYRDPKRKLDLDGTVSTATGTAGEQPEARLELKGKLEGQPLTVRFVGGSLVTIESSWRNPDIRQIGQHRLRANIARELIS